LLAPTALAFECVVWNLRFAQVPHNTFNYCAASPREYPAREGEGYEESDTL